MNSIGLSFKLLLLLITGVAFESRTINAQVECLETQTSSCGTFCCPAFGEPFDRAGNPRTECCVPGAGRVGCCSEEENIVTTCGGSMCPDYQSEGGEERDGNGNLRNECCTYFRTGCCSTAENSNLNILFSLAIGLTVLVVGLIIIFVLLILCCCYCGLCS